MGQNTWDPKNVPLLSDMWDEVKQKLSNDQHTSDFINNASLSITLPDKLTIKIPYTRPDDHSPYGKLDDKEKERLMLETEKVSNELIDSLLKFGQF